MAAGRIKGTFGKHPTGSAADSQRTPSPEAMMKKLFCCVNRFLSCAQTLLCYVQRHNKRLVSIVNGCSCIKISLSNSPSGVVELMFFCGEDSCLQKLLQSGHTGLRNTQKCVNRRRSQHNIIRDLRTNICSHHQKNLINPQKDVRG